MPATVTTIEKFPTASVNEDSMKGEVNIRLKAGCITSTFAKEGSDWVLTTVWNVIGEQ